MEILAQFGTPRVKHRWLAPLLAGEIRSAYSMTEPEVASSGCDQHRHRDPRGRRPPLQVSGRKWWSSGAMSDACKVAIVMGRSDPDGPAFTARTAWSSCHWTRPACASSAPPACSATPTVPTAGMPRSCTTAFALPRANLLGELHGGFAIAQARLGPGRDPPCHAPHRDGRARVRPDVPTRLGAHRLRQGRGRAGGVPGLGRRGPDTDRAGAAARAQAFGVADGHRREPAGDAPRSPRSRSRRRPWPPG